MQESAPDDTPLARAAPTEGQGPEATAQAMGNRMWLALSATALWQAEPALVELGAVACAVAFAHSQEMARESVAQLRAHATTLRSRISPLSARALSRVVRNAERASGQVLDKKGKLRDLQTSWDELLQCLHLSRR